MKITPRFTVACLNLKAGLFGWLTITAEAYPNAAFTLMSAAAPRLVTIFLRLRPTLRFGLRVADGLGQHLAQLSLGLLRFARRSLPLGHGQYVGCRKGKVNPCWLVLAPKVAEHRSWVWGRSPPFNGDYQMSRTRQKRVCCHSASNARNNDKRKLRGFADAELDRKRLVLKSLEEEQMK